MIFNIVFCLAVGLPRLQAQQFYVSETLKRAIDVAIAEDKELANHHLEVEKLALAHKSVLNKYVPTLSSVATYGYFNNTLGLDIPAMALPIISVPLFAGEQQFKNKGNLFFGGVTAKMALFTGGQITNGAKAVAAKKQGVMYLASPKKDSVIRDVIYSFDQVRLLCQAEKLVNESELRLNKEKERVEKAIANGLAIPYDRDKIKLAVLELASKKIELEGKRKVLYQKLNMLTHYSPAQIDSVIYQLEPIVLLEPLTTTNRAEIKALENFKTAYQFLLKKEKGSFLPVVGAFGSYSYASVFDAKTSFTGPISQHNYSMKLNSATLHPNLFAGVALKWDIFSGFERKHKIDETKINIQQIENKLADAKEKVQLQLQNNNVQYETLLRQIDIAVQREKIAQNNLLIAQKQYSTGLINVTERLTVETDIYQVSLTKINSIVEQRKLALETISATGNLQNSIQVK
ncbi:TolC family protein [Pedobacter sp. UBA4863]|uniref:TolC family protein n=1 Tax=Pedobacter sp. UBA4863 TaxID=1947060 RepID=UPI0025DAB109|nr:TolC family protein [Pedobacter sp. UBA4863]